MRVEIRIDVLRRGTVVTLGRLLDVELDVERGEALLYLAARIADLGDVVRVPFVRDDGWPSLGPHVIHRYVGEHDFDPDPDDPEACRVCLLGPLVHEG